MLTNRPSNGFDVIVIGAGAVGENVAAGVSRAGLTCAIIESDLVGGECTYWACMPSKAMLRPWSALAAARAVPAVRAAVTGDLDRGQVLRSRDAFAANWQDDAQVDWLRKAGVFLLRGHGRLTGERRVELSAADGEVTDMTARHAVVVTTGSRATVPDVPGLAAARPWTSREAAAAQRPPESLIVIGGGPVGAEMATVWASLGSDVTVLVREERMLPDLEPFAGELVATGLAAAGAAVRTSATAESARRGDDGRVTVWLPDGSDEVTATEVLVATGRSPRTEDVGVDSVGLRPGDPLAADPSGLVDGVGGQWLYAAGDVLGRAQLTHQGKYQARQAAAAIVARARGEVIPLDAWSRFAATADERAVPQVVFTRPAVATVGPTFEEAGGEEAGVVAVDYDIGNVAGAALHGEGYEGRARLVVDEGRQVVVGATFVGPDVEELLHAATVAVVGEVPIDRLWHAVPAFPTVSEVWLRLLETYARRRDRIG